MPRSKTLLAQAHARVGELEIAWRCINEAMASVKTTKEKWFEAEVHRVAGELSLLAPEPDATKAEAYFARGRGSEGGDLRCRKGLRSKNDLDVKEIVNLWAGKLRGSEVNAGQVLE